MGNLCFVHVELTVATNGGGLGPLRLSLPRPAAAIVQQVIPCKVWGVAGDFGGFARIDSATSLALPFFPESPTVPRSAAWQSTDASGAVGKGVPNASGAYGLTAGNNFTMAGWYVV
jgi:hypothetical protein